MHGIVSRITLSCAVLAVLTPLSSQAQDNAVDAPAPPPILTDEAFAEYVKEQDEPSATEAAEEAVVTQRAGQLVEEYSIQGRRTLIKVSPENAPSYYITDEEGDGSFTQRRNSFDNEPNVSKWKVVSW